MKRILVLSAALAGIALLPRTSLAQTATSTLTVNATVASSCTIDAGNLTFATAYNGTADVSDSTNVVIRCTSGGSAWVSFGISANGSGAQRAMAGGVGGNERLNYNLFADVAHSVAYDTVGTDPGAAYHIPLTNPAPGVSAYNVPVFGVIPLGQFVSGGPYADSVVSTVHF